MQYSKTYKYSHIIHWCIFSVHLLTSTRCNKYIDQTISWVISQISATASPQRPKINPAHKHGHKNILILGEKVSLCKTVSSST